MPHFGNKFKRSSQVILCVYVFVSEMARSVFIEVTCQEIPQPSVYLEGVSALFLISAVITDLLNEISFECHIIYLQTEISSNVR